MPRSSAAVEFRCHECGKLLAHTDAQGSTLEIKCTRCGLLNSIFRNFTHQVIITDANGVILFANALVETVTGYCLNEMLGKTPALWGGQMSKEFYAKLWKTIKQEKKATSVVVTNRRKDGTPYSATLQISPVFGEKDEISMYVGIESVIEVIINK